MAEEHLLCFSCGAALDLPSGTVGRSAACSKCGADVHVCKNCLHYDEHSYNECREPQADRVVDKTRSNFCDFFSIIGRGPGAAIKSKESVLKDLNALFKK